MTRQIYCNICGGPFLGSEHTWLGEAIILSTGHRTRNGTEIDDEYHPRHHLEAGFWLGEHLLGQANRVLLRFNSKYDPDTRNFYLLERKETVSPNVLIESASRPRGGSLYLPVHKACLELAEKFIHAASTLERAATDTTSGKITSELQLWEVLCRRLDQFEDDTIPKEPHHFYVPHTILTPMPWEREPDSDDDSDEHLWAHALLMAGPLGIPNITESILENLETASDTEPESIKSQDESYERLVNPRIFPWLWDLDTCSVYNKKSSGLWDWESLLCSLFQPDIHMHDNDSLHIPVSLRNRRRIWRILEAARVGDAPVILRKGGPGTKMFILRSLVVGPDGSVRDQYLHQECSNLYLERYALSP
ncbi:hypothetical protein KCU81_g2389, partial [Aureobasidium melanogenum]|uniref:Uncharacterized protein n=1 Tax=Aureobasidium melanogenum (strain CBS 110374) TaxID=1043003 RepID=A0A074W195_AURM1